MTEEAHFKYTDYRHQFTHTHTHKTQWGGGTRKTLYSNKAVILFNEVPPFFHL
jgi:hypothetical protein